MSYEIVGLILAALVWAVTWAGMAERRCRKPGLSLPPGPRRWPVVGNIFQLMATASAPPHQSLAKLAEKHGAVMTLQIGWMTTLVISSSHAAQAMFRSHDAIFAGRKIYDSMNGNMGNDGSLITAQYGPHWRMLRRLCTTEFFSNAAIEAMRGVRARCVGELAGSIADTADTGAAIDVGRFFFLMSFNLIGNLIFSKNLLDLESERGKKFFYHAGKTMEWAGKPNVADFWPCLRKLDPQGIRRMTQFHVKKAFAIAGEFLKERVQDIHTESHDKKLKKDYLDVLLEHSFSPTIINVIVFEMFTAGTDTTTSTLEWAMAELLHNSRTFKKLQSELRSKIRHGENLKEEDVENLPYLTAVIKETLRLHPPLPFLVPHMAMESSEFLGFHVPKEAQILVNVWAIGRDPKTWKDPTKFKPERFLEDEAADYRGRDFEYIPFGSGRRMCPAVGMAGRVVALALGTVVHRFDWRLPEGMKGGEMDMSERMGITLRKAVPLRGVPVNWAAKFNGPITNGL